MQFNLCSTKCNSIYALCEAVPNAIQLTFKYMRDIGNNRTSDILK